MINFKELTSQVISLLDANEEETFRNFARLQNKKILIACSGGADSIALALISYSQNIDFALVYIEHNINPTTRECETIISDLAKKLKVEFFVEHVDLDLKNNKSNIESRARDARYQALEKVRIENNYDFILTAHHLDDYVETFFINLMRGLGSGVAALSSARGNLVRPLLNWRKIQLEEIVQKCEIEYFSDPSNDLDCFVRNRVRNELIPLMDDISNRDVAPLVSKAGNHIARDQKFISSLGARSWPLDGNTSTRTLRALDISLQNHALRSWIIGDKPSDKEMSNILDVVNHEITKTQISGNRTIWRKDAKIYQSETTKLLEDLKNKKLEN